jgi:hypothetical protein
MNQAPARTSRASGSSFAAVTTCTTREPDLTPRTLIAASSPKAVAIRAPRTIGAATKGATVPSDAANALATDATANDAISQNRTPARKPKKGPNATSMYAYSPPVSDTRLPAAAKQVTINPINAAQTM